MIDFMLNCIYVGISKKVEPVVHSSQEEDADDDGPVILKMHG